MAENFQLAKTSSKNVGVQFIAQHFARWATHVTLTLAVATLFTTTHSLAAQTAEAPKVSEAPQKASVTFYTDGTVAHTLEPGSTQGLFSGSFFDGQDLLFLFQGKPAVHVQHRFVTVLMDPGPHEITANYGKNAKGGAHVKLNLEAGKEYFLRANSQQIGFVVSVTKPLLTDMPCKYAHEDLEGAAPMIPKRAGPSVQIAPPRFTFPDCPAQP